MDGLADNFQSPRLQAWSAVVMFSSVCLAAHVSSDSSEGLPRRWVTAALSLSLIISFSSVALYLLANDRFNGQNIEGGMALLMLIFWCAGLPSIMEPSNNIAVTTVDLQALPSVLDANLYFFSWVTFACVIFIVGHYIQETTGRDVYSNASAKLVKWVALGASSMVVLASSSQFHHTYGCNGGFLSGENICTRAAYGVSVGLLVFLASVLMIVLIARGIVSAIVEMVVAVVMAVLYLVAVSVITFNDGPGASISNLYFSTWISFVLSVALSAQSLREFIIDRNEMMNEVADEEGGTGASSRNVGGGGEGGPKSSLPPATEGREAK